MKKIIFSALAAALCLTACDQSNFNTTEINPLPNGARGTDIVTVTVDVHGNMPTKATSGVSATNEAKLNSLQLFVFDSAGEIETYQKGVVSTFTMNISTGKKDFIVLANCPDLGSTPTKNELLAVTSKLENNTTSSFEMVGTKSTDITGKTSVSVELKRLVSKVSIQKITPAFSSPYLAGQEFKVQGIYLTNVVGSNNYAANATSFTWFNKLQKDASNPAASITQDAVSQVITASSPYTVAHTFYCYPNPTSTDAQTATWSERHTRLVVEATLGGQVCYYPIVLPAIERNKTYTISNLIISKKGSEHPWEDIKTADIDYTISVSDWETGQNLGNIEI